VKEILNSVFDPIFSSFTLGVIFYIVVIFGFVISAFFKPFSRNSLNTLYRVLCFSAPVVILIAAQYGYFGYSHTIRRAETYDSKLWFIDYSVRSDESSDEDVLRLTIVDQKSGKKLLRKYLGYSGDILFFQGKKLILQVNHGCFVMNTETFDFEKKYTNEFLQKNFPECAAGVGATEIRESIQDNVKKFVLKISLKDGTTKYLDPLSGAFVNFTQSGEISQEFTIASKQELYQNAGNNRGNRILYFIPRESQSSRAKLVFPNDTSDYDFLEPELLAFFPETKTAFVKSYITTEHTDFILTAVDLSGQIVWKINSQSPEFDVAFSQRKDLDFVKLIDNELIINSGGLILFLDPASGKILRKVRI
jgi:hypothetical protein